MDQELKDKRRRAAWFAGSILGVLALLAAVYFLTIGRPALVGEDRHDFGFITIAAGEQSAVAQHTFTLTNRTRSPITISELRTSCGCTASHYSPEVVQPGETLQVTASLTVGHNGLLDEHVYVQTAERGVRTLNIRGVGRFEQQLRTPREEVFLRGDSSDEQVFVVLGDVWPGDLPEGVEEPVLHVDGGQWLQATIRDWSQQRPANKRAHTPAIWSGQIAVRPRSGNGEPDVDEAVVIITMESKHSLEFPVKLRAAPIWPGDLPYPDDSEPPDARDDTDGEDDFNPLHFEPGTGLESVPGDR